MNKLEGVFDRVKYDALAYIGLYEAPPCETGSVLAAAVSRHGPEIFCDPATLHQAMAEAGAPENEILRVQLMTRVSGFRELLAQDSRTAQADLDRYIHNAAEETGFNRDTVLRLTGSIVFALGGGMDCSPSSAREEGFAPQTVAALASELYEEPLRTFQTNLDRILSNGATVSLDFDRLEPLVNIGIPRAKYCLGYCLLTGIQLEADQERGLALLEEAAGQGDSRAAAALGDYHYLTGGSDHWSRAYTYYTGYGAAALSKSRRTAITNILNQKRFNRTLLGLCILLLVVLAASVIWPPAAAAYAPHPVWGWLSVLAELALLVLGILHYRVKPYDFFYRLPVAMAGIWSVYMAIRILF